MIARLLFLVAFLSGLSVAGANEPPNVLLLTVDDMNCDSVGVFGNRLLKSGPSVTPNIDRLAAEGMRFTHAHVTIAVCQPVRGTLATGLYPHRSGLEGFFRLPGRGPEKKTPPTVHEILRSQGYLVAKIGKGAHADPKAGFAWDLSTEDLGNGRNPGKYRDHVRSFIERATKAGKPFYMNVNSHDPHRPFSGSQQERGRTNPRDTQRRVARKRFLEKIAAPSRSYSPDEIVVPGFLPDIPAVRLEIAEYASSVRRADDTVGAVLEALKEGGADRNTLVVFLSDHGMALPFAKTNCYFHSTHTPWIVRWPERVKAGAVDDRHFVSTIDFLPTILEVVGAPAPDDIDGRSILPLLRGEKQSGRELVFTQFHETSARRRYPMRSVQNTRFGYIFNPWSDGERVFRNESQSGRTFRAMVGAARTDKAIAARVDLFVHRVREELYDYENDPDATRNLIGDPAHAETLSRLRAELEKWMKRTGDPALAVFRERESDAAYRRFMGEERDRVRARGAKRAKALQGE